jgi:hypothetical protein
VKKTPWQKIMDAAKKGRGLRLSADEIFLLSCDDAIETRARNDENGWNTDSETVKTLTQPRP